MGNEVFVIFEEVREGLDLVAGEGVLWRLFFVIAFVKRCSEKFFR